MPSDGFTVVPDQLRAAAGISGVHAEGTRDQLGLLEDAIRRVAEAVGNGEAGEAALDFGARWSLQLERYTELIAAMRSGLELAATAYQQTDQDNAGQLSEPGP
jgi:uncharacterized protein YukE